MKAKLALSLLGAALIALPAAAQTTTTTTPPADNAPRAANAANPDAAKASMYEMKAGQWRATKVTGLAVYNNNNERIGDINEMIISRDGKIEAVVIGVGGFLGIGEHLAAVPFDKVKWVDQPREQTVSARPEAERTTTTTGSGTTTAPADRPAATVTTTERTTTVTGTSTAPADNTRTAARDAYRGYPDHAVVDMTKEQLKALPQVRYAR